MASSFKSSLGVFAFLAVVSVFSVPVLAGGNGNNGNGNGNCNVPGNGNDNGGFAQLRLNISGSYYDENGLVWDEETNIYNGTDFQLNLTDKGSKLSRNTTLIISLHPDDYSSIISVTVNGHVIPQSAFHNGTPSWNKCNGGNHSFPSHDIFPAYYALYDIGNVSAGSSALVNISISSTLTDRNPRVHFDAVGFSLSCNVLCWDLKTPNSHDAGTDGENHDHNVPFFPGALVPLAIGLAVPVAAYKFSR